MADYPCARPVRAAASCDAESLRRGIDRIDDQLLDLIELRLEAASKIAKLKNEAGPNLLKLRPAREAFVIERVCSRARRAPAGLVHTVWRELMAHGLQVQAKTGIAICGPKNPDVEGAVRHRFGEAAPIRWAPAMSEAIRSALDEEMIAVVPASLADQAEIGGLVVFDVLKGADGALLGLVMGRVDPGEATGPAAMAMTRLPANRDKPIFAPAQGQEASPVARWGPGSWRRRPAEQMPSYEDAATLERAETVLAMSQPLASIAEIKGLKADLARVAQGRAFLLQGGDCAESFAEFSPDKVGSLFSLIGEMGEMLGAASGCETVQVARIAGQFAKPRTSPVETIDGMTLPSYRGDSINGAAFDAVSRTPDPERLLQAYRQAAVTMDLLAALAAASRAGMARLGTPLPDPAPSAGEIPAPRRRQCPGVYASHEALLLNYEQALTRFDEQTETWWATSGHMMWVGERTRSLAGAHVEYLRGIANPIGIKVGPGCAPDELMRLIDILDPDNEPGRLTLIGRFGAAQAARCLPALMRTTRRHGRNAIWSIDPMHGNSRSAGGYKTRLVSDIVAEVELFFDVAAAERTCAGGIHLEMTGSDVTECIGGSVPVTEADLARNYRTHCDPRLNRRQALDVALAAANALCAGLRVERGAA